MQITKNKIGSFFLNIYPELAKIKFFKNITVDVLPKLTPKIRKFLRIAIPIATVFSIILTAWIIGRILLVIFQPRVVTPPSITIVNPTPSEKYQSQFLEIKKKISDFSTTLPDPQFPAVDEKISIEQTTP